MKNEDYEKAAALRDEMGRLDLGDSGKLHG
ncbi:MAG: UvrB/UvrC motif-containing protein [Spirochaetales bacterium]|nr:UvrB/UvrC motif-containing protein [Spirochaetales bacterium]